MGAWDASSFGNDDAADWAWQLEEAQDLHVVEDALDRVVDEATSDDFVEAPTGSEAIAACEVIARLKGNFGVRNAYSEVVDDWVAAHLIQPSDELLAKANNVLEIVTSSKSELCGLWTESDSFSEWQASMADLQRRMNS
jgi:hypothetical protein